MSAPDPETESLLRRWRAGDAAALDMLVTRDLEWIRARAHARLGPGLRAKEETDDVVQKALLELLRYGPRCVVEHREQFRAMVARIVENILRDDSDHFRAFKRAVSMERPLEAAGGATADGRLPQATSPSQAAEKAEWRALVRAGLELVGAPDREVLLLREWEGRSFADIAGLLGTSEDAARMRFQRALARLTAALEKVRARRVQDVLASGHEGDPAVAENGAP